MKLFIYFVIIQLIRLKEKRASEENASCSSSEETGYEDEFFQPQQKQENANKEKENLQLVRKLNSHGFDKNETSDNNKESRKRPKVFTYKFLFFYCQTLVKERFTFSFNFNISKVHI